MSKESLDIKLLTVTKEFETASKSLLENFKLKVTKIIQDNAKELLDSNPSKESLIEYYKVGIQGLKLNGTYEKSVIEDSYKNPLAKSLIDWYIDQYDRHTVIDILGFLGMTGYTRLSGDDWSFEALSLYFSVLNNETLTPDLMDDYEIEAKSELNMSDSELECAVLEKDFRDFLDELISVNIKSFKVDW